MVKHSGTHDIGYLGETAVVGLLHRVENAPLHRLQTVVDIWHGAVENNVGGIVNPVFAEHARKRKGGAFAITLPFVQCIVLGGGEGLSRLVLICFVMLLRQMAFPSFRLILFFVHRQILEIAKVHNIFDIQSRSPVFL